MEIQLEIEELFNAVAELEDIMFVPEQEHYVKSSIKIKDEVGKFQFVPFLMTKEDEISRISFDDDSFIETALKHKLSYDGKNCKFIEEFKEGDLVKKADDSFVKVSSIEIIGGKETVYDLNINTETHLYQDAQGFIHHNTSYFGQIADELDLHFIHIDVSGLNRDSTTGIPKAVQATDEDGKPAVDQNGNAVMRTEFSKPPLLITIEAMIREALEREKEFPKDEQKKGKGKFKYLLLFDEVTRATPAVFNVIRKLLLEKSFNEDFNLPEDMVVAGALNPSDDAEGVSELTDHMRDVLDIVPSRANWNKTEVYILRNESPEGLNEDLGFDCNAATVEALTAVLDQYKTRSTDWAGKPVRKEEKMFNMEDGEDVIYISPRSITDTVSSINSKIRTTLLFDGIMMTNTVEEVSSRGQNDDDFLAMLEEDDAKDTTDKYLDKGIYDKTYSDYSNEDYEEFIKSIISVFRDIWAEKLGFICDQQDIPPENILSVTTGFIMKDESVRSSYDGLRARDNKDIPTIEKMFDTYYDNPEELSTTTHFNNYLDANKSSPIGLTQDITEWISEKVGEIQKKDGSGTIKVKNKSGVEIDFPQKSADYFDLYLTFSKFSRVILSKMLGKTKHIEKTKEVKVSGEYITNLAKALSNIGQDFLKKYGLIKQIAFREKMDEERLNKLRHSVLSLKELLNDAGIGNNEKKDKGPEK